MSKPVSRTGVGASSILLVIVSVCLTVFAVLALMSARSDRMLSQNTIDSVQTYYRTEAVAQRTLAQADEALLAGDSAALKALGVAVDGEGNYTFCVQDESGHVLEVAFTRENGRMRMLCYRYRAKQTETLEPGAGLALFEPETGGGN